MRNNIFPQLSSVIRTQMSSEERKALVRVSNGGAADRVAVRRDRFPVVRL